LNRVIFTSNAIATAVPVAAAPIAVPNSLLLDSLSLGCKKIV